jgi:hypothetical protein
MGTHASEKPVVPVFMALKVKDTGLGDSSIHVQNAPIYTQEDFNFNDYGLFMS